MWSSEWGQATFYAPHSTFVTWGRGRMGEWGRGSGGGDYTSRSHCGEVPQEREGHVVPRREKENEGADEGGRAEEA